MCKVTMICNINKGNDKWVFKKNKNIINVQKNGEDFGDFEGEYNTTHSEFESECYNLIEEIEDINSLMLGAVNVCERGE